MAKGTELVTTGDDSTFLALRMDESELKSIITANLGDGAASIDAGMLDRVKMPSGNVQVWMVPSLDGEEAVKSLDGVILNWGTRRVFWKDAYGEGEKGAQPDCASEDGIKGVARTEFGPGPVGVSQDCADCPLNVFGSNQKNPNAKACTELRQLFILQEDSLIPIVLNVTPGSLRNLSTYFMRLLRGGVPSHGIVTKLALEKAESKGGIDFARVVPTAGQRLEPSARARMEQLQVSLAPLFERAAREITQDDIGDEGDE